MLFGGLLLVGLRGWAFIYAHDHDPTPRADPMVHLLSHTAYDWLRYGGIALAAAGALLIVGSFVVHIRHTPQLRARHI
jgi:hypothetical protein